MNTLELSSAFKKYFIVNGNIPANYNDVFDTTQVLGRSSKTGDYKFLASICPSLKGFFNWHTHVRFGIKATVVKLDRTPNIIYNSDISQLDELVYSFYRDEVDPSIINGENASYYADQCIDWVQKVLIQCDQTDLLKYIYPTGGLGWRTKEEIEDEKSTVEWVYIFRHPKVKNELKIGMTTRHWEERYAEANMNTYTSRDLEVVATFSCKDCRAIERLIHSHFEQYRLPPKTGQKKQPEWFEFPEEKVNEVVEKIGKFINAIELLSI